MIDEIEGNNEEELERIAAQGQKQFTWETLVSATKSFQPAHKLGEGGFGPVYKVIIMYMSYVCVCIFVCVCTHDCEGFGNLV